MFASHFFRLVLIAVLVCLPGRLHAQTSSDPNEGLRLAPEPALPDGLRLSWFGRAGHTYFIQHTQDMAGLSWQYLPIIETGADAPLGYGFSLASSPFFARLRIADQTAADPYTADFDGDGVGNLDELLNFLDPLESPNTDGDNFPDDWESFYFGDLATAADPLGDQDGDGITDWEAWLLGLNPAGQPSDRVAPVWSAGAGLGIQVETATSLTLSWPEATDDQPGAVSYVLYRNGQPQGGASGATVAEIDISGMVDWQRWYVRPVDVAGNIGAPSASVERLLKPVVDGEFDYVKRQHEATGSFWGFTQTVSGSTAYYETRTCTWTWSYDYASTGYGGDGTASSWSDVESAGTKTTAYTSPRNGAGTSMSSGSYEGGNSTTYPYPSGVGGQACEFDGGWNADGDADGDMRMYQITDGVRTLVYTEPLTSVPDMLDASSLAPPESDGENCTWPVSTVTGGSTEPGNVSWTITQGATYSVVYTDPVEKIDVEEALRGDWPEFSTMGWTDGIPYASRGWSGASLSLAEAEYSIRLTESEPNRRYQVRWLEVFYPKSGPPEAQAGHKLMFTGTGGPVLSPEVYSLPIPAREGQIRLVPVRLSFDVPQVLAVNENFDERVEPDPEDENAPPAPWVADKDTPSPLRADGRPALEDLGALWFGSNEGTSLERFASDVTGVRLSILEGASRARLVALAPEGGGASGAYGESDWMPVANETELWGTVVGRKNAEGGALPDWTVYLEGLEPGKVVVRLEVDRYGLTVAEIFTAYVVRVELVARDRKTGEVGPVSGLTYGSSPRPEVELQIESTSLVEGMLEVHLSGVVRDVLSETIEDPARRLAGLVFYVDGEAVSGLGDLPTLAGTATGVRPWQPRVFEVEFTHTLSIPASNPGSLLIRAQTTPNAAGERGWADAMVHLGRPASGNPPPAVTPAVFRWANPPGATTVDQIRLGLGSAIPDASVPLLTETSANSGIFHGNILVEGVPRAVVVTLALVESEYPSPTGIDGKAAYEKADGTKVELLGYWERKAADVLAYELVRTFPRDDVLPPLTVTSTTELGGTTEEGFQPAVLRIDGLQEADDAALPLTLVSEKDATPLEQHIVEPFVFSPEYHYLVKPGFRGAPELMIVSSPVLYGETERLEVLKAGRNNYMLHVPGRPAIEGTSVYTEVCATGGGPPDAPLSNQAAFADVELWYKFLFDRPELPRTGSKSTQIFLRDLFSELSCAYEMVDGTEVTAGYLGFIQESRLLIKIGRDADPITAAIGVLEAYEKLLHTKPVFDRLQSDVLTGGATLEVLVQRNASAKAAIAPLRELALAVFEAQFSMLNEGADVIFSIQEVANGNMYAAIGVIPGIPSSINKVIIGGAAGSAAVQLVLQGERLNKFKAFLSRVRMPLGQGRRGGMNQLVIDTMDGGRARLAYMQSEGVLLTRQQLSDLYDNYKILSVKNSISRDLIDENLVMAGFPDPSTATRKFQAHHDLPLALEKNFIIAGIDPNDAAYGRWIPSDIHSTWSNAKGYSGGGPFNAAWREFFRVTPNATKAQILTFLGVIRSGKYKYP